MSGQSRSKKTNANYNLIRREYSGGLIQSLKPNSLERAMKHKIKILTGHLFFFPTNVCRSFGFCFLTGGHHLFVRTRVVYPIHFRLAREKFRFPELNSMRLAKKEEEERKDARDLRFVVDMIDQNAADDDDSVEMICRWRSFSLRPWFSCVYASMSMLFPDFSANEKVLVDSNGYIYFIFSFFFLQCLSLSMALGSGKCTRVSDDDSWILIRLHVLLYYWLRCPWYLGQSELIAPAVIQERDWESLCQYPAI